MKIPARLSALLAATAISAGAAVATAPVASADLIEDGVYSISYSHDLYVVDNGSDDYHKLTYREWRDLGSPAPRAAHTDWVKYPWSPTIYAVTFFGSDRDEWVWHQASYAEWRSAGSPAPRDAGWIEGSEFFRWGTSDELFVAAPDETIHKMTGAEWDAAGQPSPEDLSDSGFIKYSWNPTIVFVSDFQDGTAEAISYDDWREADFPTPEVFTRINGDSVYQKRGSADIYYDGPGLSKKLTLAEWKAMGSPKPEQRR